MADPSHPLVRGIDPFEVQDEPYYCEFYGQIHTLLESRYTDRSVGYVRESLGNDEPRPQLYLHPYGQGEVLYLTLGPLSRKIRHAADHAGVQRRALFVGLAGVLRSCCAAASAGVSASSATELVRANRESL